MNEEQIKAAPNVKTKTTSFSLFRNNERLFMGISLAVMDVLCFLLSGWVALYLSYRMGAEPGHTYVANMQLLLGLLLVKYFFAGLYNHNIGAVEELRRLTTSTSIVFLAMYAIIYGLNGHDVLPRWSLPIAWGLSVVTIPFGRDILRTLAIKAKLWGEPVLVFGNGMLGNEVAGYLSSNPRLGYKPVAVVDRRKINRSAATTIPVIHDTEILKNNRRTKPYHDIHTAILVVPETSHTLNNMLVEQQTMQFERIILISSGNISSCMWVQPMDIGGILGLQVGQNLLSKVQIGSKRMFDLAAIILFSPILIPLFGIIALLIKLDSKGSVLYNQVRIGREGKPFKFWKFRSMFEGADELLQIYMDHNDEMRAEYEVTHKLKNDPRVTRVGRILRKFSIDELPQLINVLMNDMSLVGPRPFMEEELVFYDKCMSLYGNVLPGITGMWQISGRSNVSYTTRVNLDEYYVRNWSIWLDLHIFIRTIMVVIRGKGSY